MNYKIPGNVLVYTRRRVDKFLKSVASRTFSGNVASCSDWPNLEPINIMASFYKYYNDKYHLHPFNADEVKNIVERCPFLMYLPWEVAEAIVAAMQQTITDVIDIFKPDYLFTSSVDNYITDLFNRICLIRGITPIMICSGSTDNTILVTSYGEYHKVREPGHEEVSRLKASLLDDTHVITYSNDLKRYTLSAHMIQFLLRFGKAIIFKWMKYYYSCPLNYRLTVGSQKNGYGTIRFDGYKCHNYFDYQWQDKISRSREQNLFIPLGYVPEASTYYWLNDLQYIKYEQFIVNTCHNLSKKFCVVLKEHWAMLGVRDIEFYNKLRAIPNVVVAPAYVNSRIIMSQVDNVLVGAGTAGVEAALRGKKVATLCTPYYYIEDHYLTVESHHQLEAIYDLFAGFNPPPNSEETQYKIVQRFLEPTLVGCFLLNDRLNTEHNWEVTSESLKSYLSKA